MATKKRTPRDAKRDYARERLKRQKDSIRQHNERIAETMEHLFRRDLRTHLSSIVYVPDGQKSVMFDKELLFKVDEVLKARGSSVEKYLEAQLIKFTKTRIIHRLDDTLTFGQYEGLNVKEICQTDLDYMHWLVIQQKSPKFGSDVRQFVEQLAAQDSRFDMSF